eukprot:scaffold6.g2596.t1
MAIVRRALRALWILLAVATLSALPWMVIEFRKAHFSVHYQAFFIAGVFVILACAASIYEVAMHLEFYNRPRLQIRVVRILCMVPIYAVDSWLSLRFKEARRAARAPIGGRRSVDAFYIDPIRECYEAFERPTCVATLAKVAYLEDEYGDIAAYFSVKEQVPHLWPASLVLRPWPMGEAFFWETKRGVLSYVIARPLMTAVSVVANIAGGVGLEIAAKLGLIRPAEWSTYDTDDNFLICIEMFVAAVAHAHAFPPRDYMDPRHAPLRKRVYCDGEFRRGCAYPYVALINNFVQCLALYCLVLMYQATHTELRPIRPLSKFVVIKAVVFFSYWQSVLIQAREMPQALVTKPLGRLLGRDAKRRGGDHDSDGDAEPGDGGQSQALLPRAAGPPRGGGGADGSAGGGPPPGGAPPLQGAKRGGGAGT